jgi:lipopolysaccharide/colanic/teichoic acid biosynthesis glycosyltransferase
MGLRKREFQILKFRSMIENAEAETGPTLSSDDDPRITPIGRFMRKYRLDELPQFFNILRGEMSLVGPRPERRFFADQLAAREPVYSMLYQVRPGLTSWGMVRFGYASSIDDMLQRLRYDLIYLENISLATDLKILLHTVNTVISGSGM